MNLLPKEIFVSVIESLREQSCRDIEASIAMNKVFATDALYDNSLLIKSTIKLLQLFFPKAENGFCEIEHYCFEMNFGKIQGQELITTEDLWDRLNTDRAKERFKGILDFQMIYTHPLIDDNPKSDG